MNNKMVSKIPRDHKGLYACEPYNHGIQQNISMDRTTKMEVRVIVETVGYGSWDVRRLCISTLDLTIDQRDRLIKDLAWLRKAEGQRYRAKGQRRR